MFRMINSVRDYAWGSTTAFSELFGWAADGTPQAELWMGVHPAAPSAVQTAEGERPLSQVLGQDEELPYLFKVLAAAQPLSIQTHPTKDAAASGFAAEENAGVPVDAPHRNYVDAHHKPELIVAITDFSALSGFRPFPEAQEEIGQLRDALEHASASPPAAAVLDRLMDLSLIHI